MDPNLLNRAGRLFNEFLKGNSLSIWEGVITRKRELETRTEEAVFDIFLVNEKLWPILNKMIIDERRDYCLANLAQLKKKRHVIETDHSGLILDLSLKFCRENQIDKKFRKYIIIIYSVLNCCKCSSYSVLNCCNCPIYSVQNCCICSIYSV